MKNIYTFLAFFHPLKGVFPLPFSTPPIPFPCLLISCLCLANSRQMQPASYDSYEEDVVFTLQTAGRCNPEGKLIDAVTVVFTLQTAGRCNACNCVSPLAIVVFTLQTAGRCNSIHCNAAGNTVVFTLQTAGRCNKIFRQNWIVAVVFTLQTAGRCNYEALDRAKSKGCFYLANSRQMQHYL